MLKYKKLVHSDERGEIYIAPWKKERDIAIFTTKQGYARGGCIHHDDEFFVVIAGEVGCTIDDEYRIYKAGMSDCIKKNIPHMTVSLTDSVIMEWGARRDDKNTYHEGYRKKVEMINNEKDTTG